MSRRGGYVGYIWKALEKGDLEHPGLHAVLTTCSRVSSVSDGPVFLAASFCQQAATMSAYKFTPRAVASPDAPQKPLVRKRARSGVVNWVQVSRDEPGRKAKKPRTAGSQQPACTDRGHQILTTAEAASFASQFWDRPVHPTKASQQEFLATCIDVDLEKNVKHA